MDVQDILSMLANIVTIGTPLVTAMYYIYTQRKNHSDNNK